VQSCAKGEAAWTQIPAEGQDAHALATPAPGVKVLAQAKTGDAHAGHGAPAATAPSAIKIEQAWTRATPNGAKVAGGFMKITNTGATPDRLIGGSADVSKLFEVHEMKMEGAMMKMRALEKGLEIKPGETIEFKPGGYHVMFIDLSTPIKEGDAIKGELIFEKAGKVKVDFKASAMGGAAPAAGNHSHGH
jgi:copper(I)-binding protein